MKIKFVALSVAAALAAVVTPAAMAAGTGPDYSAIAASVDATTIVTGITAIAGVMMLPRVAKWGYRQVMSFLR
jgi:hypothetical protein